MFRGIKTSIYAFPFIKDLSTSKIFTWTNGRMAEYLASSIGVQVSSRGMCIIHPYFTINKAFSSDSGTNFAVRGNTSLCVFETTRVFPTDQAYVSLGTTNVCLSERNTQRVLQFDGGNTTSDISLCDVLDGFQSVLLTMEGRLALHTSAIGPFLQTCLSILAIFIVVCAIQRFSCEKTNSKLTGSMACMMANTLILILVCLTHKPSHIYVTEEDYDIFIYLIMYNMFNLFRWSKSVYKEPTKPAAYSVCMASLNLLSNRLFGTTDNPCTPVIMVFVFTRIINKVKTHQYKCDKWNFIDLYLDGFLASILARYGFFTQYVDERNAAIHLGGIISALILITS